MKENETVKELMIRISQENNFEGIKIDGIPFCGQKPSVELIYTDNSFFASLRSRHICSFLYYDDSELMECSPDIEGNTPEDALIQLDKFCKDLKSKYSVLLVDSYDIYG